MSILPIELDADRRGGRVHTPAKINLFLEVLGRRADGYHEIETLMVAIDRTDTVTVREANADHLVVSGESIPATPDNLVWRALAALRENREVPPIEMHLEKRIPAGTGLGGGSGNAAGTLALLDALYPAPAETALSRLGAALGSDVPFFFGSGAAVGRGRGEKLTDVEGLFGDETPTLQIVVPGARSATAAAYGGLHLPFSDPGTRPLSLDRFRGREWRSELFNRLEEPVFGAFEPLARLAGWFESVVPGEWRMTGSGSAFVLYAPLPDEELQRGAETLGVSVQTFLARPLVSRTL